jgi:hypothetical protein
MMGQMGWGFKVESTSAKITPRAGVVLVDRMAEALGVRAALEERLRHLKRRRRGWRVSDKVLDLVHLVVAGGRALSDLRALRDDEALCGALGRERRDLPSAMAGSTAVEFLAQLGAPEVEQLSRVAGRVARDTLELSRRPSATLDVDATFVEAHKAQAKMSYHGEPGYMPMLGFVAETEGCLLGEFRHGNVSPSAGALPFLEQLVGRLPRTVKKVRLRSDSAWFNHEVLEWAEARAIEFAVTAEKNRHMLELIEAIRPGAWEVFDDDPAEQIAESVYSFEQGRCAWRLVVLRRPMRQLELFSGLYEYHVVITNMDWQARRLLGWHRERATSENWIKELKDGFGLDRLPSGRFESNAAFMQIVALAYNLVGALKRLALPARWRSWTIRTLRYRLIHIAAVWVRHARRFVLKLRAPAALIGLFRRVLERPLGLCPA